MVFYIYQIIVCLIFLLFISSKIKRKSWKIIFSVLISFLIVFEIVSVYKTHRLIDHHFYNYVSLNYGLQAVVQSLLLPIFIILMSILFYFISKKLQRFSFNRNKIVMSIILISFLVLNSSNGILHGIYAKYDLIEGTLVIDPHNEVEVSSYATDSDRFIAHAGGQIDGYKYTNSLEAIELNYNKGFRLFELDIRKTKDNIYVAVHHWREWAKIVGYKGDLPPTRKTFLQHKIHGKYTSMDMSDINVWFYNHPDAILVTDKVNTPINFSNKFVDKNRLTMELFSWHAVKDAIDAKIRSVMPSGKILKQIKGDKIEYLKKLGIREVAMSYYVLNKDKALLVQMVNAGIHIFAFHVNYDKGRDEVYFVCNERDHFYGMYADTWDFDPDFNCQKRDK